VHYLLRKLKSLRKELGLTQNALGLKLGISKQALSGYESGRRTPDAEMLIKMADLFEISVDELLDHKKPLCSEGCGKCHDFVDRADILDVARLLKDVPKASVKHLFLMLESLSEQDSSDDSTN